MDVFLSDKKSYKPTKSGITTTWAKVLRSWLFMCAPPHTSLPPLQIIATLCNLMRQNANQMSASRRRLRSLPTPPPVRPSPGPIGLVWLSMVCGSSQGANFKIPVRCRVKISLCTLGHQVRALEEGTWAVGYRFARVLAWNRNKRVCSQFFVQKKFSAERFKPIFSCCEGGVAKLIFMMMHKNSSKIREVAPVKVPAIRAKTFNPRPIHPLDLDCCVKLRPVFGTNLFQRFCKQNTLLPLAFSPNYFYFRNKAKKTNVF